MKKPDSKSAKPADAPPLVYSTTLGRAKFPEFIQMTYGDKTVIGFDRYGRMLGAIVPMEAVKILAGREDELSPQVRDLITEAASQLLAQAPKDLGVGGFAVGGHTKAPRATIELEQIEARRLRRAKPARKRKAGV